MVVRRTVRMSLVSAVAMIASAIVPPAGAAIVTHGSIVSADPANATPNVMDGRVNVILPMGDTIVVGGTFTKVRSAGSSTSLSRSHLFAFDARTGRIDPDFVPRVPASVSALAAGPDGTSVFVGGSFRSVNGNDTVRRLARLRLSNGQLVSTFRASTNGSVLHLMAQGTHLYASGTFTSVNGVRRSGLARVAASTGAVDRNLAVAFSRPGIAGEMTVRTFDITANGSTLVAIGNFSRVDGQIRNQIAVVNLRRTPAALSSWSTALLPFVERAHPQRTYCTSTFVYWVRDIDIAPDGGSFALVTTGANRPNRLCDSLTRWRLGVTGDRQRPMWVAKTGGDSMHSVTMTGAAIYAGGHQQWVNNPYNPTPCGVCEGPFPGGVSRRGISAHDPINGLPYTWNPGRDPRGQGVLTMPATRTGLWLGSDTDFIAEELHRKIAFMPLAGGFTVPPQVPYGLPGDLFKIDDTSGVVTKRRFDGVRYGSAQTVSGLDLSAARGAFALNGKLYTGMRDGTLQVRSFDGTNAGPSQVIDLHGLDIGPDPDVFSIPGTSRAIPPFSRHLESMTGMALHRGRLFYTVRGDPRLYMRYFTPQSQIVGAELLVASTGDRVDWARVRGMTITSGRLYFALADGTLHRVAWRGTHPDGSVRQVGGPGIDGVDWAASGLFVIG